MLPPVKPPVQVAGFAENQDYGVGFNTWTSGQKAGADLKQCPAQSKALSNQLAATSLLFWRLQFVCVYMTGVTQVHI